MVVDKSTNVTRNEFEHQKLNNLQGNEGKVLIKLKSRVNEKGVHVGAYFQ